MKQQQKEQQQLIITSVVDHVLLVDEVWPHTTQLVCIIQYKQQ